MQFRFQKPSFFSWKTETVLFFLAEKEKNGFKKLPQSAQSADCPLLVEGAFGRTGSSAPTRCDARSRKRADEGIGPYRMVRIRKTPPDRHHPDSVRRVVGLRKVTWGG